MFTFTPLLGAQYTASKAQQSVLEFDGGVKVLVDVGWDSSFDSSAWSRLEKHIPTLSLILLTHATPAHIGAFIYCCKSYPLFAQIPIYATSPVISMGRALMQDLYSSEPLASSFVPSMSASAPASSPTIDTADIQPVEKPDQTVTGNEDATGILLPPPTTEEIAKYFSMIHPLKFSQPHQPLPSPFSPPLNGLTITAYDAGHTVGGTLWHIQHNMESIVYAVDWNQTRENVVPGAAWFDVTAAGSSGTQVIEQLRKPTALVCSAKGADKFAPSGGRKRRDGRLVDMIRSSVTKGGTVLIPTDTSARVLELAYVLEHAWRNIHAETDNPMKGTVIYLVCKKAHGMMRLARSMLEWMDKSIVREFEAGEGGDGAGDQSSKKKEKGPKSAGPFTFKHLKLVEHRSKLEKILANDKPKVILTSDSSLDWGYSREVLQQIASGTDNLLLLTESFASSEESAQTLKTRLGQEIWRIYEQRVDGVANEKAANDELLEQVHTGGRQLTVSSIERGPLDPNDLILYQQYLATQQQLQRDAQGGGETGLNEPADALDDASSSSSEDSEEEQGGKVLNFTTSLAHSNRNKLALSDADLGVNVLLRRKNVYDFDVRGKKGRDRMFPYVSSRKRSDEYGEFIQPEDYLRAEEREEVEEQPQRGKDGRIYTNFTQKRKRGDGNDDQRSTVGKKRKDDLATDVTAVDFVSVAGDDDSSDSDDNTEDQEVQGPARAVQSTKTITLNLRIAFVDFAGLHDKRSLEMLIPLIEPRKLILTGGSEKETIALAQQCRDLLAAKTAVELGESSKALIDIFTPKINETVDASVDTNAWMVKLSRALVKKLKWQNVRSLGVVALTGQLRGPDADVEEVEVAVKKQKTGNKELDRLSRLQSQSQVVVSRRVTGLPLLDIVPASTMTASRSVTRPLHVGDLRLANIRKTMQEHGHKAEFRGEGTLLIDGCVCVRKSGTGKIEIEAASQPTTSRPGSGVNSFLAVRQRIYEGLAVVSGR
ncbi:hypothetical protein KEM56_007245 [Ascosphaera pollenicola]|nr:hypothetical protein KEM56_007245 [Ascosphaera pollenicola]